MSKFSLTARLAFALPALLVLASCDKPNIAGPRAAVPATPPETMPLTQPASEAAPRDGVQPNGVMAALDRAIGEDGATPCCYAVQLKGPPGGAYPMGRPAFVIAWRSTTMPSCDTNVRAGWLTAINGHPIRCPSVRPAVYALQPDHSRKEFPPPPDQLAAVLNSFDVDQIPGNPTADPTWRSQVLWPFSRRSV